MSRRLRAASLLYCITEVRLITFRSATLAKAVRIWSCTPSVKKTLSGSRLIFSNGRTATLFSLTAVAGGMGVAAGEGDALLPLTRGAERRERRMAPMISAAIHPPLRDIAPRPCNVGATTDVHHAADRSAMNAHA